MSTELLQKHISELIEMVMDRKHTELLSAIERQLTTDPGKFFADMSRFFAIGSKTQGKRAIHHGIPQAPSARGRSEGGASVGPGTRPSQERPVLARVEDMPPS